MPQTSSQTLVDRPVLARILAVSVRTLASLEAERVIEPAERGKGRRRSMYALESIVPAYLAYRDRQVTGREVTPRDRRDLSVAGLNELRLARERGDLIEKDAIMRAGRGVVETARARLLRLPADLRRAGIVADDKGEAAAERAVRDALEELARLESVA
jgi:phage terminase Nu1 subunit (DNA packaging protein)